MENNQPSGKKTQVRAESGMIVGNASEHGLEFVQLALQDYERVFVACSKPSSYANFTSDNSLSVIHQELGSDSMAQDIVEEWETFQDFELIPPLGLLVNLLEFNNSDPWENDHPFDFVSNPSLNVPQLIELNELFYRRMLQQGSGEILNVISRPADCSEDVHEMFQKTQELLMEIADEINQKTAEHGVHVHTLSYSPQSFVLQTDVLPATVAHDMVPKSCSARDIADYGYQVLQARRGNS